MPGAEIGNTGQARKMAPAAWRWHAGCFLPPQSQHRCLRTQRGSNTMKKLGLTIFAAAALTLPLAAQVTTALRADIPFEFVVRNMTAAPGKYVITFRDGSVVQLVGSQCYYLLEGNPDGPSTVSQEPKLVFHRYGDRYFLSQIRTASTSHNFPMSRVERELKRAASGHIQTEMVLAMR